MCRNFKKQQWGQEPEDEVELESGGDIQALMDKLRRDSDEKRNNCVHAVYTSVYLKESAGEYDIQLELNKNQRCELLWRPVC
jgi:hypothetical protein